MILLPSVPVTGSESTMNPTSTKRLLKMKLNKQYVCELKSPVKKWQMSFTVFKAVSDTFMEFEDYVEFELVLL